MATATTLISELLGRLVGKPLVLVVEVVLVVVEVLRALVVLESPRNT